MNGHPFLQKNDKTRLTGHLVILKSAFGSSHKLHSILLRFPLRFSEQLFDQERNPSPLEGEVRWGVIFPHVPFPHLANRKNAPKDHRRAQELRQESPLCERVLWKALRSLPPETGLTFRRQQPLHPYIVDFVCLKAKLIIEIDGLSHESREASDRRRDAYLQELGFTVLRFSNEIVLENVDGVIEAIVASALEPQTPPT